MRTGKQGFQSQGTCCLPIPVSADQVIVKFLLPNLNPEEKMAREALTTGQTYAKGLSSVRESDLFAKAGRGVRTELLPRHLSPCLWGHWMD